MVYLLWEQEVGGSNPLAPTSLPFLQFKKIPDRFYTGFTEDLESRLKCHKSEKDFRSLQVSLHEVLTNRYLTIVLRPSSFPMIKSFDPFRTWERKCSFSAFRVLNSSGVKINGLISRPSLSIHFFLKIKTCLSIYDTVAAK